MRWRCLKFGANTPWYRVRWARRFAVGQPDVDSGRAGEHSDGSRLVAGAPGGVRAVSGAGGSGLREAFHEWARHSPMTDHGAVLPSLRELEGGSF